MRLPGDLCRPPTRPFPRPGRSRQAADHSPVGSDISWTLGSPAVGSSGTTIGSAPSYEQPTWILAYWAAPSLPDDVGARIGSQRLQTPPDSARRSRNLLAGEGLPARLSPTVTDTPEFPDTEEVTSSNLVRPTILKTCPVAGAKTGARSGEIWPLRSVGMSFSEGNDCGSHE